MEITTILRNPAKARQKIVRMLQEELGPIRDYYGGLLEKKEESLINEIGEYLKVDKIVVIPKETFSRFANLAGGNSQPYSTQAVAASFLSSNQLNESYEEREIACSRCRFSYTPRPCHRNCPRCRTPN